MTDFNKVSLDYPTNISPEEVMSLLHKDAGISSTGTHRSTPEQLMNYMIKNKHWSPFEMFSVKLKVETPRDIARQLLRHRSFSFQEFSQRYAQTNPIEQNRECRMQDTKNRQSSNPCTDGDLTNWWHDQQEHIIEEAFGRYYEALERGIAKEVARVLLPEGLTTSHLYVNGNIRSWIHYVEVRTDPTTQKEHRDLAIKCAREISKVFPMINRFVRSSMGRLK